MKGQQNRDGDIWRTGGGDVGLQGLPSNRGLPDPMIGPSCENCVTTYCGSCRSKCRQGEADPGECCDCMAESSCSFCSLCGCDNSRRRREQGDCTGLFICLSNSSMVETTNGKVPVSSLQLGDQLFTLDTETNQRVVTEFLGWISRNPSQVVEFFNIHTDQGDKITLTASHIVFYFTDQQTVASRPASEMNTGDLMIQWTEQGQDL